MSDPAVVRVDLGRRSYDIVIGQGLLEEAAHWMAPALEQPRAVIVTDENVASLYAELLSHRLKEGGVDVETVVLRAGEHTKTFEHTQSLIERLLDMKVERKTTLIALGGGVIGDLTGFAASIILRGIPFIQVPTTLLSQVDSSVGGKTGINTRHGKNLVGSFYQPRLVLADMDTLNTLPERELRAGYAEVVKYGCIDDAAFFDWLEKNGRKIIEGDAVSRAHAVRTSCEAKARIVAADEREAGQRALLNLGHTFGHALEAETGYSDALLHGESVAMGMGMAFDLSVTLGLCPDRDRNRVRKHLKDIGLPVQLRDVEGTSWDTGRLIAHMAQDKKVEGGKITFVLVKGIGKAFLDNSVKEAALREVLENAVAA